MGVRFPSVQTSTILNANIGINTETIILTTPPLTLPLDFATVFIPWWLSHSTSTSTTSVRYRIYRGTVIAGAPVYDSNILSATAATGVMFSTVAFDTPGAVGGLQYTLTAININSTVAGGVQGAGMMAFAL